MGARGVTGKVGLNRTLGGGYQQPTYAPGASYAPKISMGRPATAAPIMRGGSQNYTIKAAANGDYINNFGSGDIVCNREFFTMTEDRPIVKEVNAPSLLSLALPPCKVCWVFVQKFVGRSAFVACLFAADVIVIVVVTQNAQADHSLSQPNTSKLHVCCCGVPLSKNWG